MSDSSVGVIIANLGSPQSPAPQHVGEFLNEFLTDPYVIDLPPIIRHTLVKVGITPVRKYTSAKNYRSIWNTDGGPLRSTTEKLAQVVEEKTGLKTLPGMRYGEPSIASALQKLREAQTVVLALQYPQHADSTRTTTIEHTKSLFEGQRLLVSPPFYNDPNYLELLTSQTKSHLSQKVEHLLISYHSLPVSHINKSDPTKSHCFMHKACCTSESVAHLTCYRHQCFHTAQFLGNTIGLPYTVSFQSRLGNAKWIQPATSSCITKLASEGIKHLAVVCPGFTADNLETLEEIGIRGNETFQKGGGHTLQLIPCLNTEDAWTGYLSMTIQQLLEN